MINDNWSCLLPHSEMLPKTQHLRSPAVSPIGSRLGPCSVITRHAFRDLDCKRDCNTKQPDLSGPAQLLLHPGRRDFRSL